MEKTFWNWIIVLALVFASLFSSICHSASIDTLSKYSFEPNARFFRLHIPASINSTRVYGLFETSDSSVVFELRFDSNIDVINMPADDVELSIEKVQGFCREDLYQNGTELHIEIELEESSFTIRSRNAEQYPLDTQLLQHEHFRLLFFPSNDLCILPVATTISSYSEFQILPHESSSPSSTSSAPSRSTKRSRLSFSPEPTSHPDLRERTATMRTAFERTTARYGKVRFATYKQINSLPTPHPKEITYIDILKDRDHYKAVQRSETREINNVWSPTFLLFFGIETLIIGGFVVFGFVMFIVLQCRPKDSSEGKMIYYDA